MQLAKHVFSKYYSFFPYFCSSDQSLLYIPFNFCFKYSLFTLYITLCSLYDNAWLQYHRITKSVVECSVAGANQRGIVQMLSTCYQALINNNVYMYIAVFLDYSPKTCKSTCLNKLNTDLIVHDLNQHIHGENI